VLNTRSDDEPYMIERNQGYFEYQLPISVKAVLAWRGQVPLLKNEREEWELPGGKLDLGEAPAECLRREVEEELGWAVEIGQPFFAWVYRIRPDRHVFILTYTGRYDGDQPPVYSNEHKELVLVRPGDVRGLFMPNEYKESIRRAEESGLFA
jgi:8-oxo-dGTP pyrophosphatase MutT (NUDIX family)